MATVKEVTKVLAVLTLAYPRAELKDGMAEVYAGLLTDIPNDILEASAKQIMVESIFFPSLAELRNKSIELMSGVKELPLPAEAWDSASRAHVDYRMVDEQNEKGEWIPITLKYKWIHPLVEQAAKLLGWPKTFPTDNPTADRSQFFKVYESLVNREVEHNKMLPEVKMAAEKYALSSGQNTLGSGE